MTINRYVRLLKPLNSDLKLQLIAYLTESLRRSFVVSQPEPKTEKEKLADELFGAWADVDGDELIKDIYESRTFSDKEINLD